MLRFLSRRKGRNANSNANQSGDGVAGHHPHNTAASSQIKSQRILPNKNQIECRVILLDGTDLSVYLTVSTFLFFSSLFLLIFFYCCCCGFLGFIFVLQKFMIINFVIVFGYALFQTLSIGCSSERVGFSCC